MSYEFKESAMTNNDNRKTGKKCQDCKVLVKI